MFSGKKGFTLLELLIVIAILAILASTTFVVLNPAEILRKTRDSQRIADLASMRTALNYFVANTSSPVLGSTSADGCTDQTNDYTYSAVPTFDISAPNTTESASTSRAVNGSGWIPVALSSLQGGSPLSTWPIDPNPSDASDRYYVYLCHAGNVTFTLFANMESNTYAQGGASDVESNDGGGFTRVYEVGTAFLGGTATSSSFYPAQ